MQLSSYTFILEVSVGKNINSNTIMNNNMIYHVVRKQDVFFYCLVMSATRFF